MLRPLRYIALILSTVCQAVLAILAVGDLLNVDADETYGLYHSVNVCVAISASITAAFICIISLAELAQKANTTTSALFEILWVLLVWVVTTVEASYLSTTSVPDCQEEYYVVREGSWSLCMAHSVLVPMSWLAAVFVTSHLVLLLILVEWHRTKASLQVRLHATPESKEKRGFLRGSWNQVFQPELQILKPILGESVYLLISKLDDAKPGPATEEALLAPPPVKRFVNRISQALSIDSKSRYPMYHEQDEDRLHLRWQDAPPSPGTWTGSYYFQARHPNDSQLSLLPAPTPVFAPSARLADVPRYQLRDEPAYRSSPLKDVVSSRKPNNLPDIVVNSPTTDSRWTPGSPSLPASPRSPHHRSNTMPTAPPPRAQLLGLSRARTLGSRRNPVPSRYGDMDLTVRTSRLVVGPPRPPPGFLPNPGGRYLT